MIRSSLRLFFVNIASWVLCFQVARVIFSHSSIRDNYALLCGFWSAMYFGSLVREPSAAVIGGAGGLTVLVSLVTVVAGYPLLGIHGYDVDSIGSNLFYGFGQGIIIALPMLINGVVLRIHRYYTQYNKS